MKTRKPRTTSTSAHACARCAYLDLAKSFAAICALLFFGTVAYANGKVLPGRVPPIVATARPIGPLAPTNRLDLTIGLPLRNKDTLESFLQQLCDPRNTNFRCYLTSDQFTALFGPTTDDYRAVINFIQSNGLVVSGTHSNRLLLDVSGLVPDIERVFHVAINVYQHPTEARMFYAPNADPSVPSTLPVLDIDGLSSYGNVYHSPLPLPQSPSAPTPNAGTGPNGSYWGLDFRAAYIPGVSIQGEGQTVGLFAFGGYYDNDIQLYESQALLPTPPTSQQLQIVTVDGFSGTTQGQQFENDLDIEMVLSVAPRLTTLIVYEGYANPTSAKPNDILNTMATQNRAGVLSSSWCWSEDLGSRAIADQILQQMAAQGQTFLEASGDGDAWCNPIAVPQDSPWVTTVGGTTLTTGSGASYASETVWNAGYEPPGWPYGWSRNGNGYVGSGGGISTHYSLPYWQQGVSTSANGGSTTSRNIPDVAMVADNVWEICDWYNTGQPTGAAIMGTSAAAPLWAGFTALANQNALASGKAPIGFLNPALYAIGKWSGYSSFFHDITAGGNNNSCAGFPAVAGYDLCTGWGSPTPNLINGLLTPDCPLTPYGLVSRWPGEGNTLDNQKQNNGVAEGSLSYGPGEVHQAFYFDGMDADVRVPASASLDVGGGNGFTVECWIEPTDTSQTHPIVQWRDPANQFWRVTFNVEGGGRLSVFMINPADGSNRYLFTQTGLISPWVWQHVAMTYDNTTGTACIYVNGIKMAQGSFGISGPTTTGPVYLGQYLWGSNVGWYAGFMDEVSIYNRVLTADEIMAIYTARTTGKCCPNCG